MTGDPQVSVIDCPIILSRDLVNIARIPSISQQANITPVASLPRTLGQTDRTLTLTLTDLEYIKNMFLNPQIAELTQLIL